MIEGKKILIVGGTGSLGTALIKEFHLASKVYVVSRDELKQWNLKQEFPDVEFFICDIRDKNRLEEIFNLVKPEIVISAAAIKHIEVCEKFPLEGVKTNTLGIDNVLSVCTTLPSVEKVLFTSSDKACAAVNAYGASKFLAEKIVRSYNKYHFKNILVRYGNIINSSGSILQAIDKRIKSRQNLLLTHPQMTRFFMTLDESVELIKDALLCCNKSECLVPILPSMRIQDLLELFAEKHNLDIEIVGIRSGEKIHEDLISWQESFYTTKLFNKYYVIHNQITNLDSPFVYSSKDSVMSKSELKSRLENLSLLL